MMFTTEQNNELQAPLDRAHVKSRSQAGRSLSYIEGWHAIAEANRIFGFGLWDRETAEIRQIGEPREVDGKFRVAYMARVRIRVRSAELHGAESVIRDGVGYGSGIDRDLGSAHESALKEAETDAMKRALMTFGNPFGLALYDKEQRNVQNAEAEPAPAPAARKETAASAKPAMPVSNAEMKLPAPQSIELAEQLVTAIRKIGTPAELIQWGKDRHADIDRLDDARYHEVREAFGMHRRELTEAAKDAVPA